MTLIPCNGPDIALSKKSEFSRRNDNLAAVHYSELFLLQAALQTLLCGWLVRIGRDTGQAAAWVLLVPQACLVYDNLIVGLGSSIGPDALLEALSWPRFWTHWLFGAWSIAGCGVILRLAGVERLRSRKGLLTFCALTLAMMMYDLPHFFVDRLYAICELDLVRYSTAVAAGRRRSSSATRVRRFLYASSRCGSGRARRPSSSRARPTRRAKCNPRARRSSPLRSRS